MFRLTHISLALANALFKHNNTLDDTLKWGICFVLIIFKNSKVYLNMFFSFLIIAVIRNNNKNINTDKHLGKHLIKDIVNGIDD